MAFTSRTVFLLSLKLYQAGTAQPTLTDQIAQAFSDITELSDNLCESTNQINVVNAVLLGPNIARGFSGTIDRVNSAITMLSAVPPLSALEDADAQLVVDALITFVRIHQALLNVVIGKHGLLTLVPFFGPIWAALVQLEVVVDSFVFYLIALIPTQKPDADKQFKDLSATWTRLKIPIVIPYPSGHYTMELLRLWWLRCHASWVSDSS